MDNPPPLPGNPPATSFPNMKPLKGKPSLFTLNGFGLGMYGRRDYDEQTGTYIKTHCLCAIFVPLLALGAYRVADATGGGWFFLGREKLSKFARHWNMFAGFSVLLIAATIAQGVHTSSPGYRARVELKEAAAKLSSGDAIGAANAYRRMLVAGTPLTAEADAGFTTAIETALKSETPKIAAAVLNQLNTLPKSRPKPALEASAKQHALKVCNMAKAADPEGALAILRELTRTAPELAELKTLQPEVLQACVQNAPDKLDYVIELATWHEEQQQFDDCYKLLSPRRDALGNTEGARLLGQILVSKGEYESAYGLLFPYVTARLDDLHKVERAYTNASAHAYQEAIDTLQKGSGPSSFYTEYDRADKVRQAELVDQFVQKQMMADRRLIAAREKLVAANAVVNVALDLGLVQLNRAQAMSDAAARTAELSAAEKTFLAIRGLAGETDEYRMFLGQVYYWLGRHAEGRQLFDELLQANQRPYPLLVRLSAVLREVGEDTSARELAEEAWHTASKLEDKQNAASMRSLLEKDNDDKILWLSRADTESPYVKVELNATKGRQALERGERAAAAGYFRQAIAGYQDMQKSPSQLNNQALVYFELYSLTSAPADRERGLALLEEAVALLPGDSVLVNNMAHHLIAAAVREIIGDQIHFDALGDTPTVNDLFYLYQDETGRAAVHERLRNNELMKRALTYVNKAMLLAPKKPNAYAMARQIHAAFRDESSLQQLDQRLAQVTLDVADEQESALQYFRGDKDKYYLKFYEAQIKKLEAAREHPQVKDSPLTRQYLDISLAGLRQNAAYLGYEVDAGQLVNEALAAYQERPDNANSWTLAAVRYFRAHRELVASDPGYAAFVAPAGRAVSPRHLIACAMEHDADLAARVARHPDVEAALKIERERATKFADSPSAAAWALNVRTDPDYAARMKAQYTTARWLQFSDHIEAVLNPMSATSVLERHWHLKMTGDQAAARTEIEDARKRGMPLPAL